MCTCSLQFDCLALAPIYASVKYFPSVTIHEYWQKSRTIPAYTMICMWVHTSVYLGGKAVQLKLRLFSCVVFAGVRLKENRIWS